MEWLLWTSTASAAPLLLTIVAFMVLRETSSIPDLVTQGQLGLYSAAAVGGALYLCALDSAVTTMRWRQRLMYASFVIILVATCAYTAAQSGHLLADRYNVGAAVNTTIVVALTLAALVGAYIVAFLAHVAADERQQSSYRKQIDEQQRELRNEFRDL